ncbi:MAG: AI-2E family transporter [Bacteroidetes bacterium QS_1_65_9]|nr:MAG: AI-2E family transporter [Bacteroidetes bacterium QS_1_65_9]
MPDGTDDSGATLRKQDESASWFTPERVIRLLLGTSVVVGVLWLLWLFANLVFYLIVGTVVAYLLRPVANRVQGIGLGRIPAIICSFVIVFGGIGLFLSNTLPFVARQLSDLSQTFSMERIVEVATSIEAQVRSVVPIPKGSLVTGVREAFQTLFDYDEISATAGYMVSLMTDIFYAVIVIPFVAFFVLKDGTQIRYALLRLVPNRYFEVSLALLAKIESSLGAYFRALLVQLGLYIGGLQYALAVGVFTGLANSIPYFGPTLGFWAGTLVGVVQSGDLSLVPSVFAAMAVTQICDNVIFQPIIFSRAAGTHPLIILFVVLIGAQLGGIVGMLIAIPLTTAMRVAIEQVLWSLRNYRILQTSQ